MVPLTQFTIIAILAVAVAGMSMKHPYPMDNKYFQGQNPLQCQFCENAADNEECGKQGVETCSRMQTACQTEIRVYSTHSDFYVKIFKGCKQRHACNNNFNQNDKDSWPLTQCNEVKYPLKHSVCRYCCDTPNCNQDLPERICRRLLAPEHGSIDCEYSSEQNSTICSYTCDKCYDLKGPSKRICMDGKTWSGEEPVCEFDYNLRTKECRKYSCDSAMLTPLGNGETECTDGALDQSLCRFTCDKDYALLGNKTVLCDNGRWDGIKPRCQSANTELNPCQEYSVFKFDYDGDKTCLCRSGYKSSKKGDCVDINECADDNLNQCHVNGLCENTIGSYLCICKPGFIGDGYTCVDVDECFTGSHDCDNENGICVNKPGGFTCVCNRGYTGDGRICNRVNLECPAGKVVQGDFCVQSFVFSSNDFATTTAAPTKKMMACACYVEGHPEVIRDEDTYQKVNEELVNMTISDKVDESTVILGPFIGLSDRNEQNVFTWADGQILSPEDHQLWGSDAPVFREEYDESPNCVHLVSDPVQYGTRDFKWEAMKCDEDMRYVCDLEKMNETATELCYPPITTIENGLVTCNNGWKNDSICVFACNEGYRLVGEFELICMDVGNILEWNYEQPSCKPETCTPPLSAPTAGSMSCTNENNIESECSFTCKVGYRLQGNKTSTCMRDNLQFSTSRPCCAEDCPPYARMNLIFVLDTSSSVGKENFGEIKKFVTKLGDKFVASLDFTQITAITYHSEVRTLDHKGERVFISNKEFNNVIHNLAYAGVGTLTGNAIEFVAENYLRLREGADDVVVLLTDGESQDEVEGPAQLLRTAGAHVLAVGVQNANMTQLEQIASRPVHENIINVEYYDELDRVVSNIRDKVCNYQC